LVKDSLEGHLKLLEIILKCQFAVLNQEDVYKDVKPGVIQQSSIPIATRKTAKKNTNSKESKISQEAFVGVQSDLRNLDIDADIKEATEKRFDDSHNLQHLCFVLYID